MNEQKQSELERWVCCEKCGKPLVRTSEMFFTCTTTTKDGPCRGLIHERRVLTAQKRVA